jgi:hypothetical protein
MIGLNDEQVRLLLLPATKPVPRGEYGTVLRRFSSRRAALSDNIAARVANQRSALSCLNEVPVSQKATESVIWMDKLKTRQFGSIRTRLGGELAQTGRTEASQVAGLRIIPWV